MMKRTSFFFFFFFLVLVLEGLTRRSEFFFFTKSNRKGVGKRLQCYKSLSPILKVILNVNGEGNGNPVQCSCLENPMDGGAW